MAPVGLWTNTTLMVDNKDEMLPLLRLLHGADSDIQTLSIDTRHRRLDHLRSQISLRFLRDSFGKYIYLLFCQE